MLDTLVLRFKLELKSFHIAPVLTSASESSMATARLIRSVINVSR
jgi:hypothetical protein